RGVGAAGPSAPPPGAPPRRRAGRLRRYIVAGELLDPVAGVPHRGVLVTDELVPAPGRPCEERPRLVDVAKHRFQLSAGTHDQRMLLVRLLALDPAQRLHHRRRPPD